MPRKALHESESAGDYSRPVSKPVARPKHDSPDNPKAYGKPNVSSNDGELLDCALDEDTRPSEPSPYTGRE